MIIKITEYGMVTKHQLISYKLCSAKWCETNITKCARCDAMAWESTELTKKCIIRIQNWTEVQLLLGAKKKKLSTGAHEWQVPQS